MFTNIFINSFFALLAFSVSGGVALHDSRLDKVFATVAGVGGDTASHDLGHAVAHELHIHGSRHGITETMNADPVNRERTHKKHTTLHHARFKLAALTAC